MCALFVGCGAREDEVMALDALVVVFDVIVALSAVIVMRYIESHTGFRLGPAFRSQREIELEHEVQLLREKVQLLEQQYRQAVEREVQAHRELDDLRDEMRSLRSEIARDRGAAFALRRRTLLVAMRSGNKFWMDLAALRGSPVPLNVIRLNGVTKEKLKRYLDRGRLNGSPIELLHIAVHADEQGLEFDDGVTDANWLSEHLKGVKVLLLAGCNTDVIGDWLGVVPYVITLTEQVSDEDAAMLGQALWTELAMGAEPDVALEQALQRAPAGMSEYVERHW